MENEPQRLPWAKLHQVGYGVLGLTPNQFWRMTPPELVSLIRARVPQRAMESMSRDDLETLRRRYPDADDAIERR